MSHTSGGGEVEGARSPRWAFMSRMVIRNRHGEQYLARLRLIDTPWFGVYLHDITAPDPQDNPHDHPWSFWSIVLRGGYVEQVFRQGLPGKVHKRQNTWMRGSVHFMSAEGTAHYITTHAEGTRTLIIRGPRVREWGFWILNGLDDLGWVHWRHYEKEGYV